MVTLVVYLSVLSIVAGCWVFRLQRKHLLISLIRLEFIILGVFVLLIVWLVRVGQEVYLSLFFLVFCVCEGRLGLSILVSIVRTHGNDYFYSFNVVQC